MKIALIILITICIVIVNGQDTIYDETFDPGTLVEPEPSWPIVINPFIPDSTIINQLLEDGALESQRDGYRVQVLTTRFVAEANSLRNKLVPMIRDSIYITYEVPNYKVRVGDFINRREAENLQDIIKNLGYSTAWIVRSRVEPRNQDF